MKDGCDNQPISRSELPKMAGVNKDCIELSLQYGPVLNIKSIASTTCNRQNEDKSLPQVLYELLK